jgi:hypothetical protein
MAHRRRDLEKRLGNVNGVISKAVDALLGDNPSRALRERLAALETERDEIEVTIADIVFPAVEFHPNAANAYREKVQNLKKALAESDEDRPPGENKSGYILVGGDVGQVSGTPGCNPAMTMVSTGVISVLSTKHLPVAGRLSCLRRPSPFGRPHQGGGLYAAGRIYAQCDGIRSRTPYSGTPACGCGLPPDPGPRSGRRAPSRPIWRSAPPPIAVAIQESSRALLDSGGI